VGMVVHAEKKKLNKGSIEMQSHCAVPGVAVGSLGGLTGTAMVPESGDFILGDALRARSFVASPSSALRHAQVHTDKFQVPPPPPSFCLSTGNIDSPKETLIWPVSARGRGAGSSLSALGVQLVCTHSCTRSDLILTYTHRSSATFALLSTSPD